MEEPKSLEAYKDMGTMGDDEEFYRKAWLDYQMGRAHLSAQDYAKMLCGDGNTCYPLVSDRMSQGWFTPVLGFRKT